MLERCEYCKKVYRKAQLKKHLRGCKQFKLYRRKELSQNLSPELENKTDITFAEEAKITMKDEKESKKIKQTNPKGKKK